jgi:hypothetical protein
MAGLLGALDRPAPASARVGGAPRFAIVRGTYCGRGHFTDPSAPYCRTCGLAIAPDDVEVDGPRPPLGVLVWDTGQVDPVDGDLIVGREPGRDRRVAEGEATGLLPAGDAPRVSRVHAEVRVEGWRAELSDRGSLNGTFVWDDERRAWRELRPGEVLLLVPGTVVALAERMVVFDALPPAP